MGPYVDYFPGLRSRAPREKTVASNGALGMAIFLLAETMFFSGLISASLILRSGFGAWPPVGQPRLPWEITAFNTVLLLLSGVFLFRARHWATLGDRLRMRRFLLWTILLGVVFVSLQGLEWLRLLHYGFWWSSGVYAGLFYLLIGCHALHAVAGLAYLLHIGMRVGPGSSLASCRAMLVPALMYWTFVVCLWPLLYGLVYF